MGVISDAANKKAAAAKAAAAKKKKLGGTAKTISGAAYGRQVKAFQAGKRKRPPQKSVTKGSKIKYGFGDSGY